MTSHSLVTPWQNKKAFEETNLHMLQNGILCDVTILAGGNKQEIKAHKFVLASRSQTFYAMLCASSVETCGAIHVPDIEFDVMETLLRFMYTEDCDINSDSVMGILHGAKKYCLSRLEEKCKKFLIKKLTAQNVCFALKNVYELGEKELEQKCLSFVMETGDEALNSDGFKALPKAVIRKIIISDNLKADEKTIYDACKKWAVKKCRLQTCNADATSVDLRNTLGDLLYLIRFPVMTFKTFASGASKDDILTAEEKVSIFHCIASKSKPVDCKFSVKARTERLKVKDERVIIKRFPNAPNQEWMYNGLPDSISFKVSMKVKLLGVSIFTPINVGQIKGNLKLQKQTSDIITEKNFEINHGPTKISEEVLFDDSIELEAGKLYLLYCKFTGPYTFYGTGGRKTVSVENINVTFIENDFSQNGTDTSEGQFHYLILQMV